MENLLEPIKALIVEVEEMTKIEKLFKLDFTDQDYREAFSYMPGQFVKLGIMGVGEAPISMCTSQKKGAPLELCIRNAGRVTNAIHNLKIGDTISVRGPYGNGFPMQGFQGSNLLLVAGGLGVAPLRGVLHYALNNRGNYEKISFLYGVRCHNDILFKEEVHNYFINGDHYGLQYYLSYEDNNDKECIRLQNERDDRCLQGLVTKLFNLQELPSKNTYAIISGPPIMYKFVVRELEQLGFKPSQIYMTLERRMGCGIGQCGQCIVGTGKSIKYVCKDGPVFTYWDALNTKGMI